MRVAGKTAKILALVIFTVATGLAAFDPPAFAQNRKGGGGGPQASPEDIMKKKKRDEEERAAKAAMDRVPDSKVKYDPWKIER